MAQTVRSILEYFIVTLGAVLIPLHEFVEGDPRSKRPLHVGWSTATGLTVEQATKHVENGCSIGWQLPAVILGIDVDVKSDGGHKVDGRESFKKLREVYGVSIANVPVVSSPSGGRHYYFRIPPGKRIRSKLKDFPGIDFLSRGGYVVIPPSRHWQGGRYQIDDLTLSPPMAPQALVDALHVPERKIIGAKGGTVTPEQQGKLLAILDPRNYRDYDDWLRLMMACHHATAGGGVEEFENWSRGDPQFAGDYTISERWLSLTDRDDGVTAGTLFKAVREAADASDAPEPILHELRAIEAAADFEPIEPDLEPVDESHSTGWSDAPPLSSRQGRTDRANAQRFAETFRNVARYCPAWKMWIVWDDCRWCPDSSGKVVALAKQVCDVIWQEALSLRSAKVCKFAEKSSSRFGIDAMLQLARSEPGIPVEPSELDRDPWLLNCPNGTINLKTGKLLDHSPDDLITKLCPTRFDSEASATVWEKALETIFANAYDVIEFFWRFIGYCLTGLTRESVLLLAEGSGANGKSTLFNTILKVLGTDYGIVPDRKVLVGKQATGHSTELMDLAGKRLAIASETEDCSELGEARIKNLTGGDTVRGRRTYEDTWEFAPSHKFILSTNHRPVVKGTDDGIWRRILLLQFTRRFWNKGTDQPGPPELVQDKQLPDRLMAEAEGILAWMVRGAVEWSSTGLRPPESVRYATVQYRQDEDPLAQFLADECVATEGARVGVTSLFQAYEAWCIGQDGVFSMQARAFAKKVEARGFARKKSSSMQFIGLTLKSDFSVE